MISGSNVKVDREALEQKFRKMDANGDGRVDLEEYKQALADNPRILEWVDLLNSGFHSTTDVAKDMKKMKLNTVSEIMKL